MTETYHPKGAARALENVPRRGVISIIVSGLLLTAHDAAVKSVSETVPVGQLIGVRGIMAMALLAVLITWRYGWREGKIVHLQGNLARAGLMIASTYLLISGLREMPLADAIAIAFVGPIMLTALAVPILGERVGWRRWTAVLLGFGGVIVMLRPSGSGIYWVALLPAGAALAGSLRDVITRRLSARDSSIAILFFTTTAVAVSGLATAPFGGWIALNVREFSVLALVSVFYCAAHFFLIEAFRYAEAGLLSTFRYLGLVWAGLFGFVIWHDIPDVSTFAGAALVVGAGLYIALREARIKHAAAR